MKRPVGIFLAAWSFGFASLHMAWAAGSRVGMNDDVPPISERPWFLAYDVVSGLLMFGAAWVAWRLATGSTTRWLRTATSIGSSLALLRGIPGIVADVATSDYTGVGFLADVWFTTAGIAGFALVAATKARVTSPPVRSPASTSALAILSSHS